MGKIFITGIYGSGKTTFADKYAVENKLPHISFDSLHNYKSKENQAVNILKQLPKSFVIDAIPFYEKTKSTKWKDFYEYQKKNNCQVICVYSPNIKEWFKRIGKRANYLIPQGRKKRLQFCWKLLRNQYLEPANISELHADIREFYLEHLPWLEKFKNVKYYDTLNNKYTTQSEMLEKINYKMFALEDRFHNPPENYDYSYQNIEVLGFYGYSESHKSWEELINLINWKNKKVVDLGCFHGYFAFKAEDMGAKVIGLDASRNALKTAKIINNIRGGNVKFKYWVGGDDIPKCDVILCLNVLHHFKDKMEAVLAKMKCKEAIFEINKDNKKLVQKYFKNITEFSSHRNNRIILLCKKI